MPIGMLILATALALGHHAFNAWEDGRPVYDSLIQLLLVLLRLTDSFPVHRA
jgi:hypothetical protein